MEIFISDKGANAYGNGRTFVGSASANGSGNFTVPITGAQAGNYVTSTATDSAGNTSEFSLNLIVSGNTPPPNTYATDSFTRNETDRWGSADTGGSYSLVGTAANFDVNGSAGTMLAPSAGQARIAFLSSVSALDVDISFRVQTDKLASGNAEYVYALARRVSSNTEYQAQVRLATNRAVYLRGARFVNGTWTALGTEVLVSGLTHTANTYIWVRAQFVDTNPTTIRIKAWADGQAEPANWLYTVTDSTANLQTAGAVGLKSNLPTGASNAPVLFTFDDYEVLDPNVP